MKYTKYNTERNMESTKFLGKRGCHELAKNKSYGGFYLKMAFIYHPKTFFTENKWWRGYIKSFIRLAWHGIKKTRLCVYQITDAEYFGKGKFVAVRNKSYPFPTEEWFEVRDSEEWSEKY